MPREMLASTRPAVAVFAIGAVALAAAAWSATGAHEPPVAERDRLGAVAAVHDFASMSAHLGGSGGDPRFAERIPADPQVVGDLLADAEFDRSRGRAGEARLVRLDVQRVRAAGGDRVEVVAKEFWMTRERGGSGATRPDVDRVRYLVRRDGASWKIAGWDLAAGDDGEAAH